MSESYFSRPRRRRSLAAEMRLLFYASSGPIDDLKELAVGAESKVSSSGLRKGITAAKGLPLLYTTNGAFLAFWHIPKAVVTLFELNFRH
jgi:hypothetical protein